MSKYTLRVHDPRIQNGDLENTSYNYKYISVYWTWFLNMKVQGAPKRSYILTPREAYCTSHSCLETWKRFMNRSVWATSSSSAFCIPPSLSSWAWIVGICKQVVSATYSFGLRSAALQTALRAHSLVPWLGMANDAAEIQVKILSISSLVLVREGMLASIRKRRVIRMIGRRYLNFSWSGGTRVYAVDSMVGGTRMLKSGATY